VLFDVTPCVCEFHDCCFWTPVIDFDEVRADEEARPVEAVRAVDGDDL